MATKKPNATFDAVTNIRGSSKESAEAHRLRRESLSKARLSENKGRLLDPNEVKGEYDMSRMLFTTLGTGELRPLTHEDLKQFRYNAKVAGTKFKGGITPQQVINLSRKEDRDKANAEIHMAVPAGANKGLVRFITNAGPDSDVSRHHVDVEFLRYEAVVASPVDPKLAAADIVRNSQVNIRCDCGRWTYWFAYLATIGNYAYKTKVQAYPKIRNPNLTGVACKHILRVMREVNSNMAIRRLIATMVDKGQRAEGRIHTIINAEEAAKIAKRQQQRRKEIVVREVKATSKLKRIITARKAPPRNASQAFRDQKALNEQISAAQLTPEEVAAIQAILAKAAARK